MDRRQFLSRAGMAGVAGGAALAATPVFGACSPSPPGNPRRLGTISPRNPDAPATLGAPGSRSVLIIGGGIAGLSAALELAEAGYAVSVREADSVLGGRLAARDLDPGLGRTFKVDHGLHMWFDNYLVFDDIRRRLSLDSFAPYTAVQFTFRDYEPELLMSEPKVFPFNLTALVGRSPNLALGNVIHSLGMVPDVLQFQMEGLYDRLDQQSFVDWMAEKAIDPVFRDVFLLPAAHVTLNDVDALSAAEMALFQHLYFTSHPWAFDRTITTEDFATAIIDPWADRLRELGATIRTEAPVPGLRFEHRRAVGVVDENGDYDWVVLAVDVAGLTRILGGSTADRPSARVVRRVQERLSGFETAPPHKVLRIWTDRRVDPSRPDVVETPEHSPLALIAQFHQLETESRLWSEETGGSIIEFHLYSLDDATAALTDEEVWPFIRPIALDVWPELADHQMLGYTVGSYENFTSFAVGQGARRPLPDGLTDEVPNLMVAGDWVHTGTPSALMERSVLTGRLAANACRFADGVREVGYDHPPLTGPLLP